MNCVLIYSLLTPLFLNSCIPSFHLHLLPLWTFGLLCCLFAGKRGYLKTLATPALSDARPTFKQCAGWIWVTIGLGGAVRFQERRHKPLLCSRRNKNGDNSEEIMRTVSACVYVRGGHYLWNYTVLTTQDNAALHWQQKFITNFPK